LSLHDSDVLVIAQKIISKSEGRYLYLEDVAPSSQALELAEVVGKDIQAVLSESTEVVRVRKNVMIVAHRLGFVMANAGIDESNIDHSEHRHRVLLLPKDPDATCTEIKLKLDSEFKASIGIIINDSFGRPWRNGVVGVALGCAGLPALATLIGQSDLFGRPLQVTEIAVADELAAAASILMGQASEGAPVVHIRGFRRDAPPMPAQALVRPKNMDMFR
jgi:coenzyme F420-0:L-glutamate ligase/coenzyme F420-1:gamma-L-glutamate ligase